ncbi:ABC transporter permease [Chlamydiifrater phoenicopteri]|uniref:ABC transporter permease n=1 Tax=Chlamydiifrater phoenicopteri TaxID=2681469 RepID=UPI001BD00BD7|nr:ABC transporter permease [Chlamydiifrater phoenicopteri]
MFRYILKRLLFFPVTLFSIILVNFVILNLAPGDVLEDKSIDSSGEAGKSEKVRVCKGPDRYLQFREHYGLTLPILFNARPSISLKQVQAGIHSIIDAVESSKGSSEKRVKVDSLSKLRVFWGDRAKFIMPILLFEASNTSATPLYRNIAADLFIRGGIRQGVTGAGLSAEQKKQNKEIAASNTKLVSLLSKGYGSIEDLEVKVSELKQWFSDHGGIEAFSYTTKQKWKIFFFETRFSGYLSRILKLDFGTMRNDPNRTVLAEVASRIQCSMILSVLPLVVVFVLCQVFGMIMAINRNRWIDHVLNILFLILFSIPVFVAVPWIIDKFVINKNIPFTNMPMPYSGLRSPPEIFSGLTSFGKIIDVITHCFLPFLAVSYWALAAQSRLSRSVFLEILNQDYIRSAYARGISNIEVYIKHVGRNAAASLVTALASSLGAILGGSLVVETLFNIDGFGKFFYQAILNRDHNVVLFSVLAGSTLSLLGYLVGDIAYALLDPRVQFDKVRR